MNVRTVAAASLAALPVLLAVPAAAEERYVLDTVHSQPGFETGHLGFSTQYGSFQKASGTVSLDRTAIVSSASTAH